MMERWGWHWHWVSALLQSEETRHSQQWHHLIVGRGALWTKEKQEHDASQEQVMPAAFVSCLHEAPCQPQYLFPALEIPQWRIVCVMLFSLSNWLNIMFLFPFCFSFFFFLHGTRTIIIFNWDPAVIFRLNLICAMRRPSLEQNITHLSVQ